MRISLLTNSLSRMVVQSKDLLESCKWNLWPSSFCIYLTIKIEKLIFRKAKGKVRRKRLALASELKINYKALIISQDLPSPTTELTFLSSISKMYRRLIHCFTTATVRGLMKSNCHTSMMS